MKDHSEVHLFNCLGLKRLTDFLIQPFPLSRLTKIGLSDLLKPRIEEEKRL